MSDVDSKTTADTRELRMETEVRAPVDAVWAALTDAEQLRRWFPLDARVTPGVGGSIWLSWGPGVEGEGAIDIWEPGRRLRWVEGGGGPVRMLVDYHLEARGGSTIVRLVHSGFSADAEWDDYYHATEGGWTYFLWNLRFYLERHPGATRHMAWVRQPARATHAEVWERLVGPAGLGLREAGGAAFELPDPEAGTRDVAVADPFGPTGRVVVQRPPMHLAVTLGPDENAVLFAELEPGGESWHLGLWLSTYGADEAAGERMQERVRALAEAVLAPLEPSASSAV